MAISPHDVKELIYESDRKHMWHAFGPSPNDRPWVVDQGEGIYVTDLEGKKYLDAMSGLWCVNVGYGQERLARAAYEQMRQLPFYPLTASHAPAALLASKLNQWLEADYRVFFSNSGSEANETAFKLARQYHIQNGDAMRYKIISRYRAYHGATMGALAATGQHQRKFRYEPQPAGFIHIQPPDLYRGGADKDPDLYAQECADALEQAILWEGPETISAFIMEPIITGGGILVPPQNYAKQVQEICRRYGVLLIIDEVICGFGRTGRNFGFQNYGIQPDIVSMAKGMTSGYSPLSATALRSDIYEVFRDQEDPYAHFRHVNTFGGHPVSCVVALENLLIFEELQLVERAETLGALMLAELEALEDLPIVGNVRGKGLLAGIELVTDKKTKEPLPSEVVASIMRACKDRGLIVGKNGDTVAGLNNVITVVPPLVIEKEQIRFIAATLRTSIEAKSI